MLLSCPAWYPKLYEKLNKCIHFCLKLEKRHISTQEFESINWLPVYKRVHQCINAIACKFVNNEVYEYVPQCKIESRGNFAKLKAPFRKTNMGQKGLSYIGPHLWNNLPQSMKKNHHFEYF